MTVMLAGVTWQTIILSTGAVVRLTRLITADDFPPAVKLRVVVLRHAAKHAPDDPGGHWSYKLVSCPWCVSPYVAAVVGVAAQLYGDRPTFRVVTLALTAAHVAGLTAQPGWSR